MARICIVSHNASGAFSDGQSGHVGGVERQTELLANWLAGRGHEVSVITWADHPGQEDSVAGEVRLLRICTQQAGIRGIRFFIPRWWSLVKALRRANADIYVQNVAEVATGQVGIYARLAGRRFVVCVASEPACQRALPTLRSYREKAFYTAGLKAADTIVVQTNKQHDLLATEWSLQSTVVPMPCQPPAAVRDLRGRPSGKVTWVGRVVPLKRLEMFVRLAGICPEVDFCVVGEVPVDSEYGRGLLADIKQAKNIEYLGRQTFAEVWQVYARTSILVCTSEYEGFPNTFLEAMHHGIPIVSTFDPDGVLMRMRIGEYAEDEQAIAKVIAAWRADQAEYAAVSERSIAYFNEFHVSHKALPQLETAVLGH